MKIGVLPPFKVEVDGTEHVVDHRGFTMRERRAARAALASLVADDGLLPDEADTMIALLWVVLRRDDPEVEFAELYDTYDLGMFADAEETELASEADDPEA